MSPRLDTLDVLLRACGLALDLVERPGRGVDRTLIRERLRLSPIERARLTAREWNRTRSLRRRGGSRMSEPAFDPIAGLRALVEHGVRFVLIGGYAAALRGSPMMTGDVDICHARDRGNLERLAEALQSLHARLREPRPTSRSFSTAEPSRQVTTSRS